MVPGLRLCLPFGLDSAGCPQDIDQRDRDHGICGGKYEDDDGLLEECDVHKGCVFTGIRSRPAKVCYRLLKAASFIFHEDSLYLSSKSYPCVISLYY